MENSNFLHKTAWKSKWCVRMVPNTCQVMNVHYAMHRLHDMHALWMKLVHVVLNQSNKFVFSVGTVSTLPENQSTLAFEYSLKIWK